MQPVHPSDPGDKARLWQACRDVGFTDRKLATQNNADDLHATFVQIAESAGVVSSPALYEAFSERVGKLAADEGLSKRLRGERGSASMLRLHDLGASHLHPGHGCDAPDWHPAR
jgi:2-oxo-4-hydroxy-4-carboxy--5-ureidoimidazoline (OHCU) decarboxylase